MVMCGVENAIRQRRGDQWGGGVVVWGIGQKGRQRATKVEIFSAAVLASDDVNRQDRFGRQGNSGCCGVQPRQRLFRPFCALGFPFSCSPGSLGGLCCSCTEQIWVVVERGLAGAGGGACKGLVLAWQPGSWA